ncbi:hypothetical protein N7508_010117 [Penicillium antarcticum]|uniref:uncharacterized protein n=1 Tax=Penicillium antarcticum TaxID=416450 RepID=UPI0023A24CD5|nr:uncharacterized protein N7508_010117 [Penicillium antarcticum]KAJ5295296.1 hypothetical protein N7508_010117 [Penicillium antarcticum]
MIEARVEIAASPSKVREIFLDFSKYSKWHTSFVTSIEPVNNAQSSHSRQPGDELNCDIFDTKFNAVIKSYLNKIQTNHIEQENSETSFQWQGPRMFGIAGLHGFYIEPANNGISTSFMQTETFSGPLGFLMSPYLFGRMLIEEFKGFNQDLKVRAET